MKRILSYVADHAIAIAGLILAVLALAGGSYAALTNSAGNVRAWARVRPNGHLIAGAGGPRVTQQINGVYVIAWKVKVSGRCATTVTVDSATSQPTENIGPPLNSHFVAGYASAATFSTRHARNTTVETFNQTGQPTSLGFDVVVVC